MLGESHRPTHDDPRRGRQALGKRLGDHRVDAGGGEQRFVIDRLEVGDELGIAVAVTVDEFPVDAAALHEPAVDPLEQGEVSGDGNRHVQVGELGTTADDAAQALRVAKGDQPGFRQRIDRHDLGAVALRLFQGAEHAWVVGPRVLPDDQDQLGLVDIVERDGALADADRLAERHAARLVAHVRAVRKVVRPEGAREQLVQERCLVTRATRRVEHGTVG